MSEKRLNDELAGIEAALGSLTPRASSVERDRLMFMAGRASAERTAPLRRRRLTTWLWPCVTAASVLVAVSFGTLWAANDHSTVVQQVVYVPVERPAAETLQASVTKPSSLAFGDWQWAPGARQRSSRITPQPNTIPDRRTPRSSQHHGRSEAVQSLT
jgi:hypothetical protein